MNHRHKGESKRPRPEQLAAYADGELDAAGRREVEAWLADHPEAAAEVESYWQLAQLCQAGAPAEPAVAKWAAALGRIEAALPGQTARQSAKTGRQGILRSWTAAAAVLLLTCFLAAGVAVMALLIVLNNPPPSVEFVVAENGEPLPVVSADDVAIISMDGADTRALVVGQPPLPRSLVLANPNEMSVESIEGEEDDDRVRRVGMSEGADFPMVIVQVQGGTDKEE